MSDAKSFSATRMALASLFAALVLSALGTPLLKALVAKGGHLGTSVENAISYCNVLFVGNLCSAVLVLLYFWPTEIFRKIKQTTRQSWKSLLSNTLLANIVAPIFLISALEDGGDVMSVILLLQTSAIFFAFFAWLMFGERVSRRCVLGLSVIGFGALTLVALSGSGAIQASHGYAVAAALFRALGSCTARKTLEDPNVMPVFLFVRNLLGALGFFVLAIQMFGIGHFSDAFLPDLWQLMLLYAAFVVVMGQLTWFHAVSNLNSETISTWGTIVPGLAFLFAWLLTGDTPTAIHWLSLGIIVAGLAIAKVRIKNQIGDRSKSSANSNTEIAERPLTGM